MHFCCLLLMLQSKPVIQIKAKNRDSKAPHYGLLLSFCFLPLTIAGQMRLIILLECFNKCIY